MNPLVPENATETPEVAQSSSWPSGLAAVRGFLTQRPRTIQQKIGYGYILAIGIGSIGALGGLLVADYYQGQGVEQLLDAQIQTQLFQDFEEVAHEIRLGSTQLARVADDLGHRDAIENDLQLQQARLSTLAQAIDGFLVGNMAWMDQSADYGVQIQELLNGSPAWLADDGDELQTFFQMNRLPVMF